MIFAALFTLVCLFGNAKLHTNSSRHHCVVSSCHTGGRPRDCSDIPDWCPNGVYKVYPRHTTGFKVFCEMKIDGGHWTVFQRRENGYVDFLRGWNDYKHGFGYLKHEFWLGNTKMHSLTSHGQYEMRIDLSDFEGNHAFAKYKDFKIGAESSKFKLTANGYYGTAGNSLEHHNGISFSTRDNDNDNSSSGNCSTWFPGGWWYNRCVTANLNGFTSSEHQSWTTAVFTGELGKE